MCFLIPPCPPLSRPFLLGLLLVLPHEARSLFREALHHSPKHTSHMVLLFSVHISVCLGNRCLCVCVFFSIWEFSAPSSAKADLKKKRFVHWMSLEVLLFKAITAIIVRYGRLSIQRNDLKCLRRETNKYYDFYFFLNLSATPTPPQKNLGGRYYHLHFTGERTKAQRMLNNCTNLHNQ